MVRDSQRALSTQQSIEELKAKPQERSAKDHRRPSKSRRLLKQLKEIQKLQRRESPEIIPLVTVRELIQRLLGDEAINFRMQGPVPLAIRELVERMSLEFLSDMMLAAIHAKRVTVQAKDLRFIQMLKPDRVHDNGVEGSFKQDFPEFHDFISGTSRIAGKNYIGKGASVRHRMIVKKRYIRPAQVRKLARMAGIRRMAKELYEPMVQYMESVMFDIIEKALIYTRHARRRTIYTIDIIRGARIMAQEPQNLAGYGTTSL